MLENSLEKNNFINQESFEERFGQIFQVILERLEPKRVEAFQEQIEEFKQVFEALAQEDFSGQEFNQELRNRLPSNLCVGFLDANAKLPENFEVSEETISWVNEKLQKSKAE